MDIGKNKKARTDLQKSGLGWQTQLWAVLLIITIKSAISYVGFSSGAVDWKTCDCSCQM